MYIFCVYFYTKLLRLHLVPPWVSPCPAWPSHRRQWPFAGCLTILPERRGRRFSLPSVPHLSCWHPKGFSVVTQEFDFLISTPRFLSWAIQFPPVDEKNAMTMMLLFCLRQYRWVGIILVLFWFSVQVKMCSLFNLKTPSVNSRSKKNTYIFTEMKFLVLKKKVRNSFTDYISGRTCRTMTIRQHWRQEL